MIRRPVHAAVVALSAAALTACVATEAGEPVANQSPVDERLAPPIDQPALDLEPFLDRPCAILTPEQAAEWTVSNPERVPDERTYTGPACAFDPDDFNRVYFGITIDTSDTLEVLYQQRETLGLFEPTEVAGYPGVFWDTADLRSHGGCALAVAVGPGRVLNVVVSARDPQSPEYTDPCPVAVRIMEQMIETIKGAS